MEAGDEVFVYGVTTGNDSVNLSSYDIFLRSLERHHPDLICLQLSPDHYVARQRFIAQKAALKGIEDFDPKALSSLDPAKPISWEELVVNLVN